jgi:Tfp pilus assembly protein PilN
MKMTGSPLNFAKVGFRNERLPQLLFGIAAVSLVAATLWHGVVLTRYLLREAEDLDLKVQSMGEQLTALDTDISGTRSELRAQRNELMTQRIEFLADVYRQKGFSWTELFHQLEETLPRNVRITSISPSAARGVIEVKLMTIGRSLADLLELVQSLEESRYFGTVMPVSEALQEESGEVAATVTLRYLAEEDAPPSKTEEPVENAEPAEAEEPNDDAIAMEER